MNREYLKAVVVDDIQDNIIHFQNIFSELKIEIRSHIISSGEELSLYFESENFSLTDILFFNIDSFKKRKLEYIRSWRLNDKIDNMVIAVFSTELSDSEVEEMYVNGVNICIHKPDHYNDLKKVISDVIMINWQYYTSGLNKSNLIMKV